MPETDMYQFKSETDKTIGHTFTMLPIASNYLDDKITKVSACLFCPMFQKSRGPGYTT